MRGVKNIKIKLLNLGLIPFQDALEIQNDLHKEIVIEKKLRRENCSIPSSGYVICCQHPHTYTLGTGGIDAHLLIDNSKLESIGASIYKTNRGGDITYHGPGQLLVYFILDIEAICPDLHKYLRTLEEIVICSLYEFEIESGRLESLTGVWTGRQGNEKKICAIGIRVKNWVTMHGIALNVNTDLRYFNYIVPCGLKHRGVVSMQEILGREQDVNIVSVEILRRSEELLGITIRV